MFQISLERPEQEETEPVISFCENVGVGNYNYNNNNSEVKATKTSITSVIPSIFEEILD